MTDVLDGALARKLGVTSPFGLLFDFFADYLYYVVAPTCLAVLLVAENSGLISVILLSMPILGGALRYARRAGPDGTSPSRVRSSLGLPTNVCAFYIFSLVFLWREQIVTADVLSRILIVSLPLLALLMPGPWRYPWLTDYLWIFIPMAVGLYLMPFFHTGILASITLGLIVIYVLFAPLLIPQRDTGCATPAGESPPTRAVVHE